MVVQSPSSGNNPRTTVQGQETGYEAQASGLQGGYSTLSPQGKMPTPHRSPGVYKCKQEEGPGKRMETWGKFDMAILLTGKQEERHGSNNCGRRG